ncbi:Large subunit ribosomal protein L29 [Phytophthora palmivora]|uniref:Large subunit ribosomal protein L29 n=1 Tax=Phytophthora palmivora TaxID=4796 RepID=A0A2P4YND3_9STRA|nr:Large subunit ribosomal protein L29 [Phytophthora palmivora]
MRARDAARAKDTLTLTPGHKGDEVEDAEGELVQTAVDSSANTEPTATVTVGQLPETTGEKAAGDMVF